MKAPRAVRAAIAALLFALAPASARAHEFVVDQACTPTIWSMFSIRYYTPVSQTFVPALDVMDAAEIWVEWLDTGTATLQVTVHADSVQGPVVGTSEPVVVPSGTEGAVHFDFSAAVPLEPGRTYALAVAIVDGTGNPMIAGGDDRPYPGGQAVLKGDTPLGIDFWFRVGADQALPAHTTTWGALKAVYR